MTGGAADGLDQRAAGAQEPFLVGVEHRDQRDFRQVEPLAQQVDADQHVERAAAQVAQDLDPLERVDVRVQVADADAELVIVAGQVLGHPLGERRHQHALVLLGARADLGEEIVHLPAHRPHVDRRIDQPGRPDDLLDHHAARLVQLVGPRRRRHEEQLADALLPLLEIQRPVVERRRQAEAVGDEHLFARPVAGVHPADLRHRLVALVDDRERVVRQVVEQRRRRLAGRRPER